MNHSSPLQAFQRCVCRLMVGAAAVLVLGLLWPTCVRAQQDDGADTSRTRVVEILHADSSSGFTRRGHRIRSLTGDVRLQQETTYLSANRVLQYVESDSIRFVGDVRIIDEGDTLRAREVLYNQFTRIGRASGSVELSDGDVMLRAPSMRYFVEAERAEFFSGARMQDSVSVLTSRRGTYWFDEKRAVLSGDVRLEQPGTIMTSDSLVHFREEDRSIGFGSVIINHFERASEESSADTTRRTILFGERAEHDNRNQYRRITGEPFLVQFSYDSTGTDTLLLRAEEIRAHEADASRRMQAVGNVRFWQRQFSAVADSVYYHRSADTARADSAAEAQDIRLYRDPVAWLKRTQVSGDTLKAEGVGERIDSLWVYSEAFVASQDSIIDRTHQLRGQDLRAAMQNNEISYVRVGPNGEVLRFMVNDQNQPDGAMQMSADYIEGWFTDGAITRARAVGGIEGTYYEEANLPETLSLEGFDWMADRRPTKASMLESSDHGDDLLPVTYRIGPNDSPRKSAEVP